jgi:signal transduction histidine kinase
MSGTASFLRRHAAEIGWFAFASANLVGMYTVPAGETIPFHFIWVSLTLLYGFKIWAPRPTGAMLAAVCGVTSVLLYRAVGDNGAGLDELSEVPLMAAMFLAMVWHARRAQTLTHEVRQLTQREREFMWDFAHSVRTTITIARGHAELILIQRAAGDTATPSTIEEDAEVVLEELDYLATMSNRLMLLANARRSDFLHLGPVALETVVEGAARRWRSLAQRHWRIMVEPATILADAERLDAALDALIENAVQHTHLQDTVTVSGRTDGDLVLIEVSDTGEGIDQERLPYVFDRYARSETSRGCGLGLAIVKAIVEAHGGRIEVTSQAGAAFTMRLPRVDVAWTGRPIAAQQVEDNGELDGHLGVVEASQPAFVGDGLSQGTPAAGGHPVEAHPDG